MMLQAHKVVRQFGVFRAVDEVSLDLPEGGLLGIAGQQPADSGSIRFKGQDITRAAPYQRARLGLVRTFQIPREFKTLSVHENLVAAAPNPRGERLLGALWQGAALRAEEQRLADKADEILRLP